MLVWRTLLVVLVAFALFRTADSKKKKKRKSGSSNANSKPVINSNIYEEDPYGQTVRERGVSRQLQQAFVRQAQKRLKLFQREKGDDAPPLGPTYEVTDEDRRNYHEKGCVRTTHSLIST